MQNSENPQKSDSRPPDSPPSDRDAKGQFKTGNPGGPGRPPGGRKTISETELRRLATPIEPADVFARLRKFDELADTVAVAMSGQTFSADAKRMLEVELENQRLASILLNQRLRQELKLAVGK